MRGLAASQQLVWVLTRGEADRGTGEARRRASPNSSLPGEKIGESGGRRQTKRELRRIIETADASYDRCNLRHARFAAERSSGGFGGCKPDHSCRGHWEAGST